MLNPESRVVSGHRRILGPGHSPHGGEAGSRGLCQFCSGPQGAIVGLGGVLDWEDAAEFVLAGATGIGLGTALFMDPALARKCAKGLQKWANRQGQPLQALIGAMDELEVRRD